MTTSTLYEIYFLHLGKQLENRADLQDIIDFIQEKDQYSAIVSAPDSDFQILQKALNIPTHTFEEWETKDTSKETRRQLIIRLIDGIKRLTELPPEKYLVIANAEVLNLLLYTFLGIPAIEETPAVKFNFSDGGLTKLHYNLESNRCYLEFHNLLPEVSSATNANNYTNGHHFTLLRHGLSEGNAKGLMQGIMDFPLHESGRAQAQILADNWKESGRTFDKVISSQLLRANETAKVVANALGLDVTIDPSWEEINNGQFAGLTPDQVQERFPERPDRTNPFYPIGEDGETWWGLYTRVANNIDNLLQQPPGKYLIVSHGGTLSFFVSSILQQTPAKFQAFVWLRFGNTGYAELIHTDGRWIIERTGDERHLDGTEENLHDV